MLIISIQLPPLAECLPYLRKHITERSPAAHSTGLIVYATPNKDGNAMTILFRYSYGESDNWDFKEAMPTNEKVVKQACAFANTQNGGVLIFGITDDRIVAGIPDSEWDEYQTRLTNILSSSCAPNPEFTLAKFDIKDSDRKIFILDVKELATKPCVSNDNRIYIRQGGTARPAKSEDIRRMILR